MWGKNRLQRISPIEWPNDQTIKRTISSKKGGGESISRLVTIYYPKCVVFNKILQDIQENSKVWLTQRKNNRH